MPSETRCLTIAAAVIFNSLSFSFRLWIPQVRVSHTGSSSPFSSILCILHVELQVLHVVLDDVDPSLSLSSSAPLSTYICVQNPFDTIALFSPLYMPIPSQPGLPYLIRDTRYSKDATDVIISFPVPQGKTKDPATANLLP